MSATWANGSNALVCCDVCGFQYKKRQLKWLVVRGAKTSTLACPECWTPDQPQLKLGTFPVYDPQAILNPRPDTTYAASGLNINGEPGGGSRVIQWGWAPVGGSSLFDASLTPNALVASGETGTVTVSIS